MGMFCLVPLRKKHSELKALQARRFDLTSQLEQSKDQRDELLLEVASMEDPAWMELVLMRDLKVVPDGWLKIYFQTSS
jgi:hypothetical protein